MIYFSLWSQILAHPDMTRWYLVRFFEKGHKSLIQMLRYVFKMFDIDQNKSHHPNVSV